jgi:hypothetical protein
MEEVGLGLALNIVQRYALETSSEQGFGIGEKFAHDYVADRTMPHSVDL